MLGFGSRNPQLRLLRIGLLILVIGAGAVFHDHGTAYVTIRIIYFVVVIAFVGYALFSRSAAKRRGPALPGPSGSAPSTTIPGPAGTPVPTAAGPGWYPDQRDMNVQRYWDGATWTGTRHFDGTSWVES